MAISKNPGHYEYMKHLDPFFFWLRDQVKARVIAIAYVPTTDNATDILTKAVLSKKVKICCSLIRDVSY